MIKSKEINKSTTGVGKGLANAGIYIFTMEVKNIQIKLISKQ